MSDVGYLDILKKAYRVSQLIPRMTVCVYLTGVDLLR